MSRDTEHHVTCPKCKSVEVEARGSANMALMVEDNGAGLVVSTDTETLELEYYYFYCSGCDTDLNHESLELVITPNTEVEA